MTLEKNTRRNKIKCIVEPSNIDEDNIKDLAKTKGKPEIISKNLAELKANKISQKRNGDLVLELIVLLI